jgi:hypothetical protein
MGLVLLYGILSGFFLSTISVTDTTKIYIDSMLSVFQLGAVITTLLFIVPFFSSEKEILGIFFTHGMAKKTLFYGCVFGIYTMMTALNLLLWILMLEILYLQTGLFLKHLWPLFLIYTLQNIYLISIGIFWSLLLSNTLARLITLIWYTLSFLIHYWYVTIQNSAYTATRIILHMLYYLVPDFTLLDIQPEIMYQLPLNTIPIVQICLYILCYSFLILTAARWRFIFSTLY